MRQNIRWIIFTAARIHETIIFDHINRESKGFRQISSQFKGDHARPCLHNIFSSVHQLVCMLFDRIVMNNGAFVITELPLSTFYFIFHNIDNN